MTGQPAMLVQGLTKDYTYFEKEEGLRGSLRALFVHKKRSRRAVRDFSFVLEDGGIVGLMGPNGAGKTTLIKVLAGILQPTAGSARVLGFDPSRPVDAYKKQFALVMGQKSQLWWDLPATDTFLLNRAVYEIPEADFRQRLGLYSEMFNVGDLLKVPVRQLSLGERMKMELIASLLHGPKILFLDEPTIGLDAIAQRQIRELVRQVNHERGVAVLLTSHYMEDIRSLCSRVMVIRQGEKIYDGDLDALLDRYKETVTVRLRFREGTRCEWTLPGGVEPLEHTDYQIASRMPRARVQSFLSEALAACEADDVRIEEEDIFSIIYSQVGTFGGWTLAHMVIFVGTFTILDAVYMSTYFFGVINIPERIRSGSLDLYLVKPASTLFMVSVDNLDLGSILLTVPGILMVAWGVRDLGIRLTFGAVAGYILLLVVMYFLMYCLMVILRVPAFWLVRINTFQEFENSLVEFSFRIPGVVYRGVWKLLLYVVLPYGLMATIPAQFITGGMHLRHWLLVGGVAAGFWAITILLWRQGLRHYGSASS